MRNLYQNIDLTSRAMDASWKRNEVIANNIANVNTPDFKKSTVEFETILKETISRNTLRGKITHRNHIPIGVSDPSSVEYQIDHKNNYSARRDGNNVDIDVEMAERAKNELWYQTLSTSVSGQFHKLRTVITEGSK